jgi:hypothetical protein
LSHINLQFGNGAAQRVAVHSQLPRGPALVAVVFLQHGENEALFEFAYCLGVQNIALVHLQDECFELISHGIPLSFEKRYRRPSVLARFRFRRRRRSALLVLLFPV